MQKILVYKIVSLTTGTLQQYYRDIKVSRHEIKTDNSCCCCFFMEYYRGEKNNGIETIVNFTNNNKEIASNSLN